MDFFFVDLEKRFRIFGRTLLALDSGPDPFDPPGLLVPDVDVAVDEKSVVLDVATLVRKPLVDLAAELEQLLATGPDLPGALLGDVELRLELRPEGCDPVAGAGGPGPEPEASRATQGRGTSGGAAPAEALGPGGGGRSALEEALCETLLAL